MHLDDGTNCSGLQMVFRDVESTVLLPSSAFRLPLGLYELSDLSDCLLPLLLPLELLLLVCKHVGCLASQMEHLSLREQTLLL